MMYKNARRERSTEKVKIARISNRLDAAEVKSIQVAFVCLQARKTFCFISSWLSKLILCSRVAVVTQRIVCGIPQRN